MSDVLSAASAAIKAEPLRLVETARLRLVGHLRLVWAAAFSPRGNCIATGSWDDTARLWDAVTGAQRGVLRGHSDTVVCVAFAPDGTSIVTGSRDGTARLWDAATGAERATLHGHKGVV